MDFRKTPIVELAAIVASHLQNRGIEVVLVGGLAVEIYTENLYLTKDIDLVNVSYNTSRELNQAMAELGFYKAGRVYMNPSSEISIEFPTGPLAVGGETIQKTTTAHVSARHIPILHIHDVIKDRLAAYLHWQDSQSLVQALTILTVHPIPLSRLRAFCVQEGSDDFYKTLQTLRQQAKQQQLTTMAQLEKLVADYLIHSR